MRNGVTPVSSALPYAKNPASQCCHASSAVACIVFLSNEACLGVASQRLLRCSPLSAADHDDVFGNELSRHPLPPVRSCGRRHRKNLSCTSARAPATRIQKNAVLQPRDVDIVDAKASPCERELDRLAVGSLTSCTSVT